MGDPGEDVSRQIIRRADSKGPASLQDSGIEGEQSLQPGTVFRIELPFPNGLDGGSGIDGTVLHVPQGGPERSPGTGGSPKPLQGFHAGKRSLQHDMSRQLFEAEVVNQCRGLRLGVIDRPFGSQLQH